MANLSLQYIAGFIDGEGSIGMYRAGSYVLRVCVVQAKFKESNAILEELAARFGGGIYDMTQQRTNHQRAAQWCVYGVAAYRFLKKILKHLLIKKSQAALAISWMEGREGRQKLGKGNPHSEKTKEKDREFAEALKRLKRPGSYV